MDFSATHRALLARPVTAVLTTVNADGSPHAAPVWFFFEDGIIKMTTPDVSVKARNIGRDSRVAFTLFDPDSPLSYIGITGVADLSVDDDHVTLDRVARHYGYPNGSGFVRPGTVRVEIAIKPVRVSGT